MVLKYNLSFDWKKDESPHARPHVNVPAIRHPEPGWCHCCLALSKSLKAWLSLGVLHWLEVKKLQGLESHGKLGRHGHETTFVSIFE